jgi:hypothetical protein
MEVLKMASNNYPPISERILGNKHLASNLRTKLRARFGADSRANEILENLSDEELIQHYLRHSGQRVASPSVNREAR